ncbi:SusC/RagA family TonB-linked outer membrane protein [Sphingobacterium daejeonense]|uniref:SusC/RagA family TonB-linked outer membrane protein n=1 Tax=Sphingobacterium daejeonense TaxID=371142 RepID=A0ABW3RLP6_9SPHI
MKLFTKVSIGLCLYLVSIFYSLAFAQGGIRVTGKVMDEASNEPIIGATITVIGGTLSTSTDNNGAFVLDNVPENSKLRVSYLGYNSQEVIAQPTEMTISLITSTNTLEDVVVIGYGSVKRKDVTTAISSVSLDDINERPIVNANQAIQGKAAGVTVSQPSGAPGGGTSIRIRGTTSFNGSNNPLYVVDGVTVDNINFLSPGDIADMQVLKDASSAAIYGSRAANGVILITTKQGRVGNPKITLNVLATQNRVTNSIEPLNTAQYKELMDEIGSVNLPGNLTDQTNWFDETFATGNTQDYQFSVSDGSERIKYFLSGGYINDKGIIKSTFYKRYNFRGNIENKVRDWLTINANFSYADYNGNGMVEGLGSNRGGVVLSAINTPTYAPIWDPFNPKQYYNNFYGLNINSPLENLATTGNNRNRENRLIGSGSATIHILPELNFKTLLAIDRRNAFSSTFLDPLSTSWGRNQYGEATDNRNMNTVLTFDNVLNYNKSFDKHSFEVMAGSSWLSSNYTNSYIMGSHFRNDLIETLNVANQISWTGTGSAASNWAMMSYFGRLSYNYDGKYLITANLRTDGSSKLHPDHRWSVFPSVSAAWRISSEEFMKDATWINDLKIRGGWGQTGNQDGIGDYAYLQRYNVIRSPWFEEGKEHDFVSISPQNLRTPDLRWEKTTQTGVGLDFTGINNRLTVNLDYYFKKTSDMLMWVDLPGSGNISQIQRNEGEMTNRGFETNINADIFQGEFEWTSGFNISFNRNKLTKLELKPVYYDARTSDFVNDDVVKNEVGRPVGGFYGYVSQGVDPETGNMIYADLNNDGKTSVSDKTYIGDPNPNFTFGFTNNLYYKGFNLNVFIQGTQGNDIYNVSRMEMEGMYDGKNQSTRVLQRWRVPGQVTEVPRAGYDMKNSSYFIEDGSYIRLKNVSLSYNIKAPALSRIGINKLAPFISASNLITLTKYTGMDPEVNQWGNSGRVQGLDWGTYPQTRAFVVGLNMEF